MASQTFTEQDIKVLAKIATYRAQGIYGKVLTALGELSDGGLLMYAKICGVAATGGGRADFKSFDTVRKAEAIYDHIKRVDNVHTELNTYFVAMASMSAALVSGNTNEVLRVMRYLPTVYRRHVCAALGISGFAALGDAEMIDEVFAWAKNRKSMLEDLKSVKLEIEKFRDSLRTVSSELRDAREKLEAKDRHVTQLIEVLHSMRGRT